VSKKPPTDQPTTEPTPDEIIAEGMQVGLDWIAERFGRKIRWSTLTVATMRNAARSDVSLALRPPPGPGPPPLVIPPPKTSPPARTPEQVDRDYR
jgi:hypothetical protein